MNMNTCNPLPSSLLGYGKKMPKIFSLLIVLAVTACLSTISPLRAQVEISQLEPLPEGAFTIVIIPDTQAYVGPGTRNEKIGSTVVTNPSFDTQTQFIIDNIDDQRIVFVSHVGDIVDNRNNPGQWQAAKTYMDRLNGRVPYAISVGNHDMSAGGNAKEFQSTFPASTFSDYSWYGGTFTSDSEQEQKMYGNNVNSYQLFSVDGIDFIFLHLQCNAPDPVLEWANKILTQYSNRQAFITTHMYLGAVEKPVKGSSNKNHLVGRMKWTKNHGKKGNNGEQLWEKLFRHHANIVAVFSGDQSAVTTAYERATGDSGNTVHAFMSDYRWQPILRLYRFIPSEEKIQMITYDISKDKLVTSVLQRKEVSDHQSEVVWKAPAAKK